MNKRINELYSILDTKEFEYPKYTNAEEFASGIKRCAITKIVPITTTNCTCIKQMRFDS